VVLLALAAESAGSLEGDAIVEAAVAVSKDGTECASFAECKPLLEAGEDIDYTGVGGPLNLDDVGDPAVGRYAIAVLGDATLEVIGEQDVDLSQLG
jgi:branched-chain amino acid transport system substrate-binding protein